VIRCWVINDPEEGPGAAALIDAARMNEDHQEDHESPEIVQPADSVSGIGILNLVRCEHIKSPFVWVKTAKWSCAYSFLKEASQEVTEKDAFPFTNLEKQRIQDQERIEVPVLVLIGKYDPVIPPSYDKEMRKQLNYCKLWWRFNNVRPRCVLSCRAGHAWGGERHKALR
jgi:pimeloyl-ACP methyl ester carboxylesterase